MIKLIAKIFRPFFKLTQKASTPTDHELDNMIEEYLFLIRKTNHLLSIIIRKKLIRFFRYQYKILIILLILGGGIYSLNEYTDFFERTRYIFVKPKEIDMTSNTKTILTINEDSVFNPKLKEMFDYISGTESKDMGNYSAKNETSDAIGRYQFTPVAREVVGLGSCSEQFFMDNPILQDAAMYTLLKVTDKYFQDNGIYKKYVGKSYKGRYISKMGLLSLAHAEGTGYVVNYLSNLEKYGTITQPQNYGSEMRLTFNPNWELSFK